MLPVHDILSLHSYTGGAALDVFGLSGASTPAKLTPSSNPGAAAALLASSATGDLTLTHLHLSDLAAIYTAVESWIGPSSTAGVYFKGGYAGFGTTTPPARLSVDNVADNAAFLTEGISIGRAGYPNQRAILNYYAGGLRLAAHDTDNNAGAIYLSTWDGANDVVRLQANSAGVDIALACRALQLIADGDSGGVASTTALTNGTVAVSTGSGTVKMGGATNRNSEGWLKLYVGTTAVYVPYWVTITG
jgi:hypothetical protein